MRNFDIPSIKIDDYRYRMELHSHTYPASLCSEISPERLVELYAELGFDAVVLTNHIRTSYPHETYKLHIEAYNAARNAAQKMGIRILYGTELCFVDVIADFLVYGVEPEDTEELFHYSKLGYKAFAESNLREKCIVFHAHPYRNNRIGVELYIPEIADGVESINMHPCVNSDNGFVTRTASRRRLLTICGTDFHHEGHQGMAAVLVKKMPESQQELRDLLAKGDYLFEINENIIIPSHMQIADKG